MRAEKYINKEQLESNIRAQKIPHKILVDALSILELYDKYQKEWEEKKEDWTNQFSRKFVLSLGAFKISPLEVRKALHFLQWIPLNDEYGEDCYEKGKLTLDGFFNGIYIEQTDGPGPYSEEAIYNLWNYAQKDEVRLFLKEYLDNNKEQYSDETNKNFNKKTSLKNKITIDLRGLIYLEDDKDLKFKVSDKKLGIIKSLSQSQRIAKTLPKLKDEIKYSKDRTISTAINNINKSFIEKLKQPSALIISTGSGYGFDRSKYFISILNK